MRVRQPIVTVIQHQASCSLDLFADWMSPLQFDVRQGDAGDKIPAQAADALIVLGGEMSALADADAPWLPATRALILDAVDREIPMLGVCLGAQLLGVAAGGALSIDAPAGPERGSVQLELTADSLEDPLFRHLPAPVRVTSMHADVVSVLPPDAVRLAYSDRYANEAFRVGPRAWGVQFHPEASCATFEAWVQPTPGLQDGATLIDDVRRHEGAIHATARTIAEQFTRIVLSPALTADVSGARMPAARVERGLSAAGV